MDNEIREDLQETEPKEEASLLKYLAKLTPDDVDRLVDIVKNPNAVDPVQRSQSLTDYLDLVRSVFGSTNFNSVGNSPQTRNQRYEIYDEMDENCSYISAALDILSDDAIQPDEDGIILHVKSDSEKITNIVSEFIEEYELEDRVAKWARAIAKYGDLFIRVEGEIGKGVGYVNDTIYPGLVDRRDLNGKLVAFTNNQNSMYTNEDLYAPWEFVHFRHKGDIYKEESSQSRLGLTQDRNFQQNLTSAYGQSILRPAIKTYAQLRFVENMILLSRLTNSIRRNIFLINVGDVTPEKAYENIRNYANLLKKDINFNIEEGAYASAKHTINYDEDIFLPVGDPQNDVRIEQVGGDANMKEQYDLEYLLNKLFSALKIPKAYLNYEQDLNARSTLVQLDIRYARSVSQLQNTVISGVRRLVNVHLAYLGLNPDELDLDISLTPVSSIDEEARMEYKNQKIRNATDAWNLLSSMKDTLSTEENTPINLDFAAEQFMIEYLDMDKSLVDKVFNRPSADEKSKGNFKRQKIYSGTDVHAMYPNTQNQQSFERLRERLIESNNVGNETVED